MRIVRPIIGISLFLLFLATPRAFAEKNLPTGELRPGDQQSWIVNDYRYEPGSDKDDANLGLSMCGTRCNAMSLDYRTVIDPGGYRLIRVAENREIEVDLNNPYIGGRCICIADEYIVRLNEFNRPKQVQTPPEPGIQSR